MSPLSYTPPKITLKGWVGLAFFSVLLALFLRTFVVQTFKIPSSSMLPTLQIGDNILVNRFCYGFNFVGEKYRFLESEKPQRGDVVVFYRTSEQLLKIDGEVSSGRYYVKRIAGIPGDTIEIRNHRPFINDTPLDESHYLPSLLQPNGLEVKARENYGPLQLQENMYFVLGDNRVHSEDSRYFGPIQRSEIQGKAFLIYWSWTPKWPELNFKKERFLKLIW